MKSTILLICMSLFLVGCNRTANMMGGNVRVSSASLTPVAVLNPTSNDPLNNQGNPDGYGNHAGELKDLQIEIVYLNPKGYSPLGHSVYYINELMEYEVRVTNVSNRTFSCLMFSAQHQYYETVGSVTKGQPMDGASTCNWDGVELNPHTMVVLKGSYFPPLSTQPGIDQTGLLIKHCNDPGHESEHAALMYYNPEQGVFDPPRIP
jgi:hypothetical protein